MSRLSLAGLCLLGGACAPGARDADAAPRAVPHALTIVHPGDPKAAPQTHVLEQLLDTEGAPVEYRLWVDSVICRDAACRVVKVRLSWNPLGAYVRYEVEAGAALTKSDHVPFGPEDHAKLHRILLNRESPLREVEKEHLTGPRAQGGLDGVTGPTLAELASAVVAGAGYTCYDLWHWANGRVADVVRDLSGNAFGDATLRGMLGGDDVDASSFALEQLLRRRTFDRETVDEALRAALRAPVAIMDPVLEYLHGAVKGKAYHDAMARIFEAGDVEKRIALLGALGRGPRLPPLELLELMAGRLHDCRDYLEAHLFLELVEAAGGCTPGILRNVAPLLDHPRFFVARRAYRFLENRPVDDALRAKMQAFRESHRERL